MCLQRCRQWKLHWLVPRSQGWVLRDAVSGHHLQQLQDLAIPPAKMLEPSPMCPETEGSLSLGQWTWLLLFYLQAEPVVRLNAYGRDTHSDVSMQTATVKVLTSTTSTGNSVRTHRKHTYRQVSPFLPFSGCSRLKFTSEGTHGTLQAHKHMQFRLMDPLNTSPMGLLLTSQSSFVEDPSAFAPSASTRAVTQHSAPGCPRLCAPRPDSTDTQRAGSEVAGRGSEGRI